MKSYSCLVSAVVMLSCALNSVPEARLSAIGAAFGNDEDSRNSAAPIIHDPYASGKVLAVERYGDRFAIEISIGADDGIQVGLGTHVYVGPGLTSPRDGSFPKTVIAAGQVVDVRSDSATCNIGPSRGIEVNGVPQTGDSVLVRRIHERATFIVAKNVVVHDRRIIDWVEVRDRLAELNQRGLIAPSIRFTSAVRDERAERLKEFERWCIETTGRGSYSYGSLNSSVARYYDSIKDTDGALRNASLRKVGVVTTGRAPVPGAEVIVCTLGESSIHELYVEHGQLRDPHSEPTRTRTELNGKFDIFPESDRFQVLVLHESGFAIVNSDDWPKEPRIVLEPWAQISGQFDGPVEFDETAHFEVRRQLPGWAELRLEVWDTPLGADRSFRNRRIPPGKVFVTRAVKSPRGGSTGIAHESFELTSGATRRISIGPHTDEGRKKAEEYLRNEGVHR